MFDALFDLPPVPTTAPGSGSESPTPGDAPSAPDAVNHRIAIYGHQREAAGILRAVVGGQVGQTYLLAGPPAVGKRTFARFFAQALLCPAMPVESRPCGVCRTCRLVAAGGHPDLHLVPTPLRIEAARELQHDLALSPSEGERRVAILPDMDVASPGAANSLLKTLEEPPRAAVILLTTQQIREVLPTVRSRCQTITLRPLPIAETSEVLQAVWGAEPDRAALLARLSGGRLGWAVRALTDETLLASRQVWLDGLAQVLAAERLSRFELAAGLVKLGDGLTDGLAIWSGWWRDVLLVHHGLESAVVNRDRLSELAAAAGRLSGEDILRSLTAVQAALRRLAANANVQLVVEVLVLDLP